MLCKKWIAENAEELDAALKKRAYSACSQEILGLMQKHRETMQRLQTLQERSNLAAKKIGQALQQGQTAQAENLKAEVKSFKQELINNEAEEKQLATQLNELLAKLPNIPAEDVPVGRDESDNLEVRRHLTPPKMAFEPKEHYEIGENLGLMDFEQAGKIAGARFTFLKAELAQLERALGQFMVQLHTEQHGYTEVSVPLLVRDCAAFGTAQLPKFEEDLFKTTDGRWLISTAEISLTNLVYDKILNEKELPLRFTALTPCFRSEAGAAGRDTRGMLRQHQFWKVELVSLVVGSQAKSELDRMVQCAEQVLRLLGIPFRTMLLCTGDMGFAAKKTYDIEAWLPGQKAYREISSCSWCGNFQARRMHARFRPNGSPKGVEYLHSLNGSGVAVGRCLIALLENYQQEDGSVFIPEILQPFMGGKKYIGQHRTS